MFGIAKEHHPTPPKNVIMKKQSSESVRRRRNQFIASWREYAPDAIFGKLTLSQFEEQSNVPLEVRQRLLDAETKASGLRLERNQADQAFNKLVLNIANAIRGNDEHGEDSALYRSLGYVAKSERRTGMTRRLREPKASGQDDTNAA